MKVLVLIFATTVLVVKAGLVDVLNEVDDWSAFKGKNKKMYATTDEEQLRMKIFLETLTKIATHNARFDKGEVGFRIGINQFADLLLDEFTSLHNGYKKPPKELLDEDDDETRGIFTFREDAEVPDSINWVEKGAVTPVKNQEDCGACWAFSSTGALEAQHFLETGDLVSLSEQNLIDCTGSYGNFGCKGGYTGKAFKYVKENNGIATSDSYPYEANNGTCRYDEATKGATNNGFKKVPSGDEEALKRAVGTVGPVSIAIDSSLDSFFHYESGIYDDPDCKNGEYELNHAVLLVGYGTDEKSGKDYWLVKNSWGESWGEGGYVRIARNANNVCGVATEPKYPVL